MMSKKKVILRAPLLTNSGYGVHCRQVFSWLYKRKDVDLTVECLQWGRTSWMLNSEAEGGLIGKIMECSKPTQGQNFDISFQVQLPDEWDPNLAKINVGITALIETDKCSQEWVERCNKMDQIVVPSTFTKNVLRRSGNITKPVRVIPEWYNSFLTNKSEISKILNDERFNKINTGFNILMIGTLTSQIPADDRKNLANTIKWLCEEFKGDKDVSILLKTNFGKGTTSDFTLCKEYIEKLKEALKITDCPKINLLHGNMTSKEVAALYNHHNVKLYASATRGEGYGLPLIEAAVAGLPIVATGWSGHLEFLDKKSFGVVDYNLVEIGESRVDDRIFKKGFRWAEPVESSFKREVRKVYENYKETKTKSRIMSKRIMRDFSEYSISKKYDALFDECFKK